MLHLFLVIIITLILISIFKNLLFIVSIIITIFSTLVLKYVDFKNKNNYDKNHTYYRDLIVEAPPLIAGCIESNRVVNIDDIIATLIDLIERKYINLEIILIDNLNKRYILSVNRKYDISKLKRFEREIILLIINKEEIILNERIKEILNDVDEMRKLRDFMNAVSSEIIKTYYAGGIIILISVLPFFTFIFGVINYRGEINGILIFLLFMINMFIACKVMFNPISVLLLKKNNYDLKSKIKGLKKYIEDFSKLDEKKVEQVKLWGRYIAYAISFDIADKINDEFNQQLVDNDFKLVMYELKTYFKQGVKNKWK